MSGFQGVLLTQQDIYTSSSTQQHALGTRGETVDGRVFRYCAVNSSADATRGELQVAGEVVANHENMAVASAASVGDTSVTVTLGATAATANQYAEGYLVINDAAGEGTLYRVKGHPAADASASLTVQLLDPIAVALTTSSEASLVYNVYDQVQQGNTDQADLPVGIPNFTLSSGEYGWLQTWGVCSALADEAYALGDMLTIGTDTAGALEMLDAVGEPLVGTSLQTAVDTEHRAVFLMLAP